MQFGVVDFIVLAVYLLGVAYFGLRASGKQSSAKDYFLGGTGLPWWAVLFSVVATETSTLTFISIPAVAYGGDLTFLQITIGYLLGRIFVALFFLPRFFEGEMFTAYTFMKRRFGDSMRIVASSTFMITRLLADGVRLFATAIPLAIILSMTGSFNQWSDLQLYLAAILLISSITLVYTYFGGIKAVVWMDVIQLGVYLGGALIAVFVLLQHIDGGWNGMLDVVRPEHKTRIIDWGFDLPFKEYIRQPYTFFVAVIGGAVFSLASHGTDHLIIQRLLATGNLKAGQKALIGSGIVAMMQFALFLIIGLLLYTFYQGMSAKQLGLSTTDEIFAQFIVQELPTGISGLIVAALFAAAMSSLSSSLNSLSSTTTYDLIIPYWNKNKIHNELKISRASTLIWGAVLTISAVSFAWLQLSEGERPAIVELGLGIASYTYGGLLGVFLLGLFSQRPITKDALIGFFSGLILLLFIVNGPVQALLPGNGLIIAWPLYTLIGSATVVVVGLLSSRISGS